MVTVAIVGAAASSGDGLGLVHLWLVRIIVDVVLTLGRTAMLKDHTNQDSEGRSGALKAKRFLGVLVQAKQSSGMLPLGGG